MQEAGVLLVARGPDPKLAKAALAPFHLAADGLTTTSASGFVLLHGGDPVVVASAALLLPLLRQQRREQGILAGASGDDLAPGAQLHAVLPCSGGEAVDSSVGSHQTAEMQLLGIAELPGVRHALLDLVRAPSISPNGWQLGWLLHRRTGSGSACGSSSGSDSALVATDVSGMLEAACHVAVLGPTTPPGAAALNQLALSWPVMCASSSSSSLAALQPGQPLAAVGAPFGNLAPKHFINFLTTGVVSALVPGDASSSTIISSSGGTTNAASRAVSSAAKAAVGVSVALLLSDMRCSPGMEGGPVFAASPATAPGPALGSRATTLCAAARQEQQQLLGRRLVGMLLLPIKGPAAQVEFATIAPLAAVTAAVADVLAAEGGGKSPSGAVMSSSISSKASRLRAAPADGGRVMAAAAATTTLAEALPGVVAIAAGSTWASGVFMSSAGHILTNAHMLPPAAALAAAPRPGGGGSDQLQQQPAAASSAVPLRVLLPAAAGAQGRQARWAAADVLYIFQGPLDLAVLQLQQPCCPQQAALPAQHPSWRPLALATKDLHPGQPVCVVGFPAFNPHTSPLQGPLVTAGNLAKVVRLPGSGRPAMLLTTAAVHSGASGGAVLDVATGQLLGLVTSNVKHTPSRSGSSAVVAGASTVLPHLNFSIPAVQLQPVVAAAQDWAAAAQAMQVSSSSTASGAVCAVPSPAAAAMAAWQALDAEAAASPELQLVWHLDHQRGQLSPCDHQQEQQQQQSESGGGGGTAFGGATPPASLRQLLHQLEQQQQQRSKL